MVDLQADSDCFLELPIKTGWGNVLARFREWIRPRIGWRTLDVGCGPGLLPALLAQKGCLSLGVDLDLAMLPSTPLHRQIAVGDVSHLPFPAKSFDLVSASNLLFLLSDPQTALRELVHLLRPGGQIATLNPTENLTLKAAVDVADKHKLSGLARKSLLNWAVRSEAHFHWTETETARLFLAAGLKLTETTTTMGPGFARFARGARIIVHHD